MLIHVGRVVCRLTIEQAMAQSSYLKDSHVAPSETRDASKDKVSRRSPLPRPCPAQASRGCCGGVCVWWGVQGAHVVLVLVLVLMCVCVFVCVCCVVADKGGVPAAQVVRGSDMEFEFEKIPNITSAQLRDLLMLECAPHLLTHHHPPHASHLTHTQPDSPTHRPIRCDKFAAAAPPAPE